MKSPISPCKCFFLSKTNLNFFPGAYILPKTWKDSPPPTWKTSPLDLSFFFISSVTTWKTSQLKLSTSGRIYAPANYMCRSAFTTFFSSIYSIFAKLLKASLTNEKNPSHKLKRVTIKLKIAFGFQIDIPLYQKWKLVTFRNRILLNFKDFLKLKFLTHDTFDWKFTQILKYICSKIWYINCYDPFCRFWFIRD